MSENEGLKKIKENKKKKKNIGKIILLSILGVIAISIAVAVGYYNHIRNQVYVEYTPTPKNNVEYTEVDGITNVLLIGTDGRTTDEPARSDSIIIATLDNNNKKVKLTSILRDTLVNIPEYGEDKINAAFYYGALEEDDKGNLRGSEAGAALLMNTIEENFNIHLDKYIIVNFWGFESIIDEIGGIEADIKDYEIDEINKYIGESTGVNSPPITETGLQTLNGQQALSYARIRYVGNGGFERGERQNKVLLQVATKLKEVNPLKYVSLANTLSKQVKTNIDIPEALNLAYTIYKLPSLNFEQLQIPQTELIARDNLYKDRGWCLLIDIEQNAQIMNDFIFNDKLPNSDEFDLASVQSVAAMYNAEEARYNSVYNINPSDYNDKNSEEEVLPTPPKEETPSNNNSSQGGNTNNGSNGGNTNGSNDANNGNNTGGSGSNDTNTGNNTDTGNNSDTGNNTDGSGSSGGEAGNVEGGEGSGTGSSN
ncbi:LCP family protein [Clostridium nigeriense]|uniref:LCP family protein n=1 Tax=Clostridium nigeriense TaxID=1805470 RepID=UPI003D3470A4